MHQKGQWEEKESIVRELYGLESMDRNVLFALCCGTRSSPAVSKLKKIELAYVTISSTHPL